jgi:hypothetical protein
MYSGSQSRSARLRGARVRGDESTSDESICFYVFLAVLLQQIRSMNIIHRLPGVITLRVSLPFNQILQGTTAPKVSMVLDGFDLILSFSFNKIWWWSGEIQPMLCHLVIG